LKILLYDVDSVWTNLALMKISSWHKAKGDFVALTRLKNRRYDKFGPHISTEIRAPIAKYDKVYISCIFTKNAGLAKSAAIMFQSLGMEVEIGGSGVNLSKSLPEEVEHQCPDYSLYNLDYSMGFLTRGCIRRCPWCIVWQKEGDIKLWSPLKEFLRHKRVMLLDNNLLAHPEHKKLLNELIRERVEVCFTQGLDIRLIDNENAKLLKLIHYRDTKFNKPRLYFSWDVLDIENHVLKGIETLEKNGIRPNHLMFYILCGFHVKKEDYTWEYFLENDWYRFEVLAKKGCRPFIMRWNRRKDIPLLTMFSRWVNKAQKAKKKSLGLMGSFQTWLKHQYSPFKIRKILMRRDAVAVRNSAQ